MKINNNPCEINFTRKGKYYLMKKPLLIITISILILICLTSCGNNYDDPFTLVCEHFAEGRISSEIFYNRETKQTWVYEYKYNEYGSLTDTIVTKEMAGI